MGLATANACTRGYWNGWVRWIWRDRPSPFAELYPATERVHGHPDFRVMAISRGDGFEIIFVRADTVGVFQQLRQAVLKELEQRTGRNLDSVLVMGATHTHSGPGRVIDREVRMT